MKQYVRRTEKQVETGPPSGGAQPKPSSEGLEHSATHSPDVGGEPSNAEGLCPNPAQHDAGRRDKRAQPPRSYKVSLTPETWVACHKTLARIYPSGLHTLGARLDGHHFSRALNITLLAVCRGIMELPASYIDPKTGNDFATMWPPAFDARKESDEETEERVALLHLMRELEAAAD